MDNLDACGRALAEWAGTLEGVAVLAKAEGARQLRGPGSTLSTAPRSRPKSVSRSSSRGGALHLDGFGDPVAVMALGAGPADVETVQGFPVPLPA
jgi:hypothetical protein